MRDLSRISGFLQKRLCEHPGQGEVLALFESFHSEPDIRVTGGRLIDVRSKQPIPPGERVREIRLALPRRRRVMHTMHVRRHEDGPQQTIESRRDTHVRVFDESDRGRK